MKYIVCVYIPIHRYNFKWINKNLSVLKQNVKIIIDYKQCTRQENLSMLKY